MVGTDVSWVRKVGVLGWYTKKKDNIRSMGLLPSTAMMLVRNKTHSSWTHFTLARWNATVRWHHSLFLDREISTPPKSYHPYRAKRTTGTTRSVPSTPSVPNAPYPILSKYGALIYASMKRLSWANVFFQRLWRFNQHFQPTPCAGTTSGTFSEASWN